MSKLLVLLLLSARLFSFNLTYIETKRLEYIHEDRYQGYVIPMDGFSIFGLTSNYLAVDAMGKRIWSIFFPSPDRIKIFRDSILVKRDPFLFVYDLKTGEQKEFYQINLPSSLYQVSLCQFMRKKYFIHGLGTLRGKNIIKWIDVYEANASGQKLKKKFTIFSGISPEESFSSKDGIIIVARAPHNHFTRGGFSDIYAGLYLLGPTGRIIASYRLYGKYVLPKLLYRKGNLAWISYTEYFEQERKKSGIIIFDTARWKLIKQIRFSASFANINRGYPWSIKEGKEVLFPVTLRNGELLLVDRRLNIRLRVKIHEMKNFLKFVDKTHDCNIGIRYLLFSGHKIFIMYSIDQYFNDPRHGGNSRIFVKNFKVFSLEGKLLFERNFPADYLYIIPVVDTKNKVISFIKGDKIEINRIS